VLHLFPPDAETHTAPDAVGRISWDSDLFNPWAYEYSMCLYRSDQFYYDSSHTFGSANDTAGAMGTLCLTVTDSQDNPIPGADVYTYMFHIGVTDSSGHLRRRIHAMNLGMEISAPNFNSEDCYLWILPHSVVTQRITLHPAESGVQESSSRLPGTFILEQNSPNPFNATLNFQYGIPTETDVSVSLFDLSGHRIFQQRLGNQAAGFYRFIWNASSLSSGIYFYQVQASALRQSRRCVIVK